MGTTARIGRLETVRCEELGRRELVDTSACCEVCHSANGYAGALPLGPCLAVLPGGDEALVCCAVRNQLRAAGRAEAGTRGGVR